MIQSAFRRVIETRYFVHGLFALMVVLTVSALSWITVTVVIAAENESRKLLDEIHATELRVEHESKQNRRILCLVLVPVADEIDPQVLEICEEIGVVPP